MMDVRPIGIGLVALSISLILIPIYNPVKASNYRVEGKAMVHWYELTNNNMLELGEALMLTGGYVVGTHSTITLAAASGGWAIVAAVPAIVTGTAAYYEAMRRLHGPGARGDDILNVGPRMQGYGVECTISDVNIELLDSDYQVLSTGKSVSDEGSIPFTSFGARLEESFPGTNNPAVKVHWWYDVGTAVRYRLVYTVDRPDCVISPEPRPRLLATGVLPSPILERNPTSIFVRAYDQQTFDDVAGRVLINNTHAGFTNTRFTYTFNSDMPGTIIAPNYPNTTVYFNTINPVAVNASPTTVDLGSEQPVQVLISATDRITGDPVAGKVLTNEGRSALGSFRYKEIGDTNTPFTHTFVPNEARNYEHGIIVYKAPEVIVEAPTHDRTPVPINFTNIPEMIGDPVVLETEDDLIGCDLGGSRTGIRADCPP